MKYIESADNPIIKKVESLKQRKYREKEGLYLIEGFNICSEALKVEADIELFLIRKSLNDVAMIEPEIQAVAISDKLFDRLMDTEASQGVAAIVRKKTRDQASFFKEAEKAHGNLLVMDRIQDPGNAGTLLRTAEAAGFQGVIAVKGTVDLYSPKVVRSAAGTLLRIPLLFTESEEETVRLLHANGKRIVTAAPYCENNHFEARLDRNLALVIGNEGGGASDIFLDRSDCRVKIPMAGAVESLNAAVAAGILMFETVRQNFQTEVEE